MAAVPQTIDSIYRVVRPLGEGLTGEVYLVESGGETLALKLLKAFGEKGVEENVISAFKFEFGLLKDLRHPHVVGVREFGFDAGLGRYYFTEEFLEGVPLSDYGGKASPETLADLFVQAVQGLQAIHRAHMLHGDLKGSNLLILEEDGMPVLKIIDLGLADPRLGLTAGTPSTMPPEKILGDAVDERADLYSLGVTFYSLFTGENPFVHGDYRRTYEAQLTHRPAPVTRKNPKLAAFWNEIFATLLEKNPANRYRNCEELLEAIDYAQPHGLGEKARSRPWSPDRWVERARPLDGMLAIIQDGIGKQATEAPPVFLLVGESGVGKSRTLQEIRYRLQLEKFRAYEWRPDRPPPDPEEGSALWFADDWAAQEESRRREILGRLGAAPASPILVTAAQSADAAKVEAAFRAAGRETVAIPIEPFSREELEDFLLKITGLDAIPVTFLDGLWENTAGNPRQVAGLLEQFVKQRKLLDPHGTWHLAIFDEEGVDFSWLPREIPQIDRALLDLPENAHKKRSELWIQRSEELLKKDLFAEAADALDAAEAASQAVSDVPERFALRATLFERRGYHAIRTGRYDDARRCFEKAQVFLEETPGEDSVLSIRLHNYLAWLACKAGDVDRGIRMFLEQGERWERLPLADRIRVLNNELGFAYLLKGDFQNAIAVLEQSLEFFGKIGNAPYYLKNLYNLAEAYLQAKEYGRAAEKYLQAAQEARFQKNFELLLRIYNGIGKAYHLQGEFKEGLVYYRKALELARYLGDLASAAGIAQNIGSNLAEHGDLPGAEENLDLAIKMLKKLPEMNAETKYFYCRALLERGDVCRKKKSFDEALGYVHEARVLAFQENFLEFFRFWVVYTQCLIETDRRHGEKRESLLAELVSLADDEEKESLCKELLAPEAATPPEEIPEKGAQATRLDSIRVRR